MARAIFSPKQQGASKSFVFDFISDLAVGETISTATVVASVYSGVDATPSAIVSGAASISGTQVTQLIVAGVVGVLYNLQCTITTSVGQTLVKNGLLAIESGIV